MGSYYLFNKTFLLYGHDDVLSFEINVQFFTMNNLSPVEWQTVVLDYEEDFMLHLKEMDLFFMTHLDIKRVLKELLHDLSIKNGLSSKVILIFK